jgi:hypothetical protein
MYIYGEVYKGFYAHYNRICLPSQEHLSPAPCACHSPGATPAQHTAPIGRKLSDKIPATRGRFSKRSLADAPPGNVMYICMYECMYVYMCIRWGHMNHNYQPSGPLFLCREEQASSRTGPMRCLRRFDKSKEPRYVATRLKLFLVIGIISTTTSTTTIATTPHYY